MDIRQLAQKRWWHSTTHPQHPQGHNTQGEYTQPLHAGWGHFVVVVVVVVVVIV